MFGSISTPNKDAGALVRLSELKNFEVADGEPDVRGWGVLDSGGDKVGTVKELIVDPDKMLVRYLEVALDQEVISSAPKRRILVPVGFATLSDFSDRLMLRNLPANLLSDCPEYDGARITRDFEMAVRKAFVSDLLPAGIDFYAGHVFDGSGIFGPRPTSSEPNASLPDEII